MITENLSTLKIHKLKKEQYDREFGAGRIDENALYLTPDEEMDLSGYATVEQLNTKADTEHTHTTSDITDFQESLNTAINEAITQAKESGELKGDKGDDGISVTHSWNGTTLTITSASGTSSANLKGDKGDMGADGYTPVRGTDYWTAADKAEIKAYVDEAILGGEW
jgi:hypothetical protein